MDDDETHVFVCLQCNEEYERKEADVYKVVVMVHPSGKEYVLASDGVNTTAVLTDQEKFVTLDSDQHLAKGVSAIHRFIISQAEIDSGRQY